MKLDTNLNHLETAKDLNQTIAENENVMVCCGRMGPMCIPVYEIMENLEAKYPQVEFRDFPFDSPEAGVIRNLPECKNFQGLPFTVYYKNGKVIKATSSIQTKQHVTAILDEHFKS